MNKKLQITLFVIAAYLAISGALFMFAPRIAEMVLNSKLPDASLNILYGQLMLTFALTAVLAARGGAGTDKSSLVILVLTVGHVVVFGFQLASGMMNFAQAGPPLIINAIFTGLLFFFRRGVQG